MNTGKTLFAQLMDFLPWTTFTRIVDRYGGDHRVRTLSCAEQYRSMAFAQLTYRESLHDIETCLSVHASKLYHMGFRQPVRRSTLADANERRDWRIHAALAQRLITQARTLYVDEELGLDLTNTVYALDSTTIALCLSVFPWAHFRTSPEGNLHRYLSEIRKFPMLDVSEEYMLAKAWREHDDVESAHKLVTSHLRLVAKIAMGYRGYGLPVADLISEGNVGMMQAVKRFDPERGFRLATYAMWWIRASIQEYVLHSWSLVKIGTTAAQKKLFFNLRKLKGQLQAIDDGDLHPDNVTKIAERLNVSETDVISMNRRLAGGDSSLNASPSTESDGEWMDWLVDETESQEIQLAESQELSKRRLLLNQAMRSLNDRERHILMERRLRDEPKTLEDLSQEYDVSRERIRQIEVRAFEKLQRAIRSAARDSQLSSEA